MPSGKLGTQDRGVVPCLPAERRTTELPGCPVLAKASRGPFLDHISGLSSIPVGQAEGLYPWSFNTAWMLNRRGVRNDKMKPQEQYFSSLDLHE
jgi:hypothetical protein